MLLFMLAFTLTKCEQEKNYIEIPNGIIVYSESYATRIMVYSPKILRVTRIKGKIFPRIKALL